MKKIILTFLFMCTVIIGINRTQAPSSANNGNELLIEHPKSNKASVGGGMLILFSLGLGYGLKKLYEIRSRSIEDR